MTKRKDLIEKWGESIASDILYLEEMACCLYQPTTLATLVLGLRYLAQVAKDLASDLEKIDG